MTPGPGIFRTQLPQGFTAGGINAGVRRYRPDLGIIISEPAAVGVGVYTQSSYQAAPVKHCLQCLPADNIKAIITNSGQANAATGEAGFKANQMMAEAVAAALACKTEQVATASTGVIGEPLAIDKITQAMPTLVASVSGIAEKFACAILTTDLVPKTVMKKLTLAQGEITLTGICKGSGMIHPNMATMLGYLLTDVKLSISQAELLLKSATDKSFNMISVDGETSTNDSVFLLANGASGVTLADQDEFALLQAAFTEIAIELAKSIVRDGEGASKLIEVKIINAATAEQAQQVAKLLITSPLIKTAVHGAQANWGRVIARLGQAKVPYDALQKSAISFQGHCVFSHNAPVSYDEAALDLALKADEIKLHIDLSCGASSAFAWGCDLSAKYVSINAEYLS